MQNREFQRWEGWEKQYLKVNYLNVSDNLLANKLQRSTTAVKQYRINKLKLKRYDDVGFNKQLNEKYFIIRNAFIERSKIIRIHKQVTEMKSLISAYENETSLIKRAKIKSRLLMLSGLVNNNNLTIKTF